MNLLKQQVWVEEVGVAVGYVTDVAANMVGSGIHDVWFDARTFYNVDDTCELKDSVLIYKYHDYNGFLGATTRHYRNCMW